MITSSLRRILSFSCGKLQQKPFKLQRNYNVLSKNEAGNCYLNVKSNCLACKLESLNLNTTITKYSYAKFNRGKKSVNENSQHEEKEDDDEDSLQGLDSTLLHDVDGSDVKIIRTKLNSLRLDTLLKAGLGTSKSKVETAFYESKIRVNGNRVLKKSKQMNIGDEIDLIKGYNELNPVFLDISRVMIISAENTDTEKIAVILKRFKQLVVENYPDSFKKAV